MSSINSVRKLQILYFSEKKKKIKNLKNGGKKGPDIGIYTYYCICMYVCMYVCAYVHIHICVYILYINIL